MKIATWNVNSVRARADRLFGVLERHKPDVLCLQELKAQDELFPLARVREAGYHAATFGQKTYNGVAILSRSEPREIERGLRDGVEDPQARFISALVDGVRVISVYVPNGAEVGSDKYTYKLAWLARLREYLDKHLRPGDPIAICGDYNVAPSDLDVARPEEWKDSVLCHPTVREALARVCAFGLLDSFRALHAEGGQYSWWDYRTMGFQRGNGLRIDHVLVTPGLAARCREAQIDRDERKGQSPSDHAPVLAVFE
jgi:exodeoxyribonuclease-3